MSLVQVTCDAEQHPTERTPLLPDVVADADTASLESGSTQTVVATPLPTLQLTTLCILRLVDPISYTQIFPYINQMILRLHIVNDPSQVGFYSGLVESAFSLAELTSIFFWAMLSDAIGRRPVVLISICMVGIATILFGLSTSITWMLVIRCLAGLSSGNIAVFHSMLGEMTDATNQATAFPMFGLIWPLGSIIGPLIGGALSDPAAKLGGPFANDFFKTYPYFLPGFIAGSITLSVCAYTYVVLEETHPNKRPSSKSDDLKWAEADSTNEEHSRRGGLSILRLLTKPIVAALCASGFLLSLIYVSFDVLFVLFCYSPVSSGGLGFSAASIGYSLAVAGAIAASSQLLVMPRVLRRYGAARVYAFCMAAWPFAFAGLPLINWLARRGLEAGPEQATGMIKIVIWVCIFVVLAFARVGGLCYSVSMILVKENAPSPSTLSATNGLVQFVMCVAQASAPLLSSSCFALSVEHHVLGGYLWVLVMLSICLVGSWVSGRIEKCRPGHAM